MIAYSLWKNTVTGVVYRVADDCQSKVVEICDHNPRFDPTNDIPSPAVGTDGG